MIILTYLGEGGVIEAVGRLINTSPYKFDTFKEAGVNFRRVGETTSLKEVPAVKVAS